MKRYVLLPVSFADHRVESIEADPATTAGEMVTLLANKIGLREEFGFSICISIYDKVSILDTYVILEVNNFINNSLQASNIPREL